MIDFTVLKKKVKSFFDDKLWCHTLGVVETSIRLAKRYHIDEEKAAIAALLHDYGKTMSLEEVIEMNNCYSIVKDSFIVKNPHVLHGPVARYIAEERFNIYDCEVLEAIELHTFGSPTMCDLSKIIYIADIIEPSRKEFDGLSDLREEVFNDLNSAMILAIDLSIKYLLKKNKPIYIETIKLRNDLINNRGS